MSDSRGWTRRGVIGAVIAGPLAAQHAGHAPAVAAGSVAPSERFLSEHEFATLRVLCDLILPADDVSPAASGAGTPEYIDMLCRANEKLALIYHGGLAWLDSTCISLHGVRFGEASEPQQVAILEKLAYREKTPPEWQSGSRFFDWVRRMTIDGFYTSEAGYKDVGYKGGHGMTTYEVPQEALRQALEKVKL
jgi:gluconate 2-dehydrogenase subunit 3-like protein